VASDWDDTTRAAALRGSCHCGNVVWTLSAVPEAVTACNCTICRRYGALWAYGYIGHDITVAGDATTYRRRDGGAVDFHFCPKCGCVTHYVATKPSDDGRLWTAVNLRLSEFEPISSLPIDHFDGLDTFDDLPRAGRSVADLWS